jgi:hypothetical protein
MGSIDQFINRDGSSAELTQKLMVHGFVCPENSCALAIEVRRGMPILSKEGQEVGKVAAVILDVDTQKATHLLLGRLPEMTGYWLVPVECISEVQRGNAQRGKVQLHIPGNLVDELPLWQSSD